MYFKLPTGFLLGAILIVSGGELALAESDTKSDSDDPVVGRQAQLGSDDVPVESIDDSKSIHTLKTQQQVLSIAAIPATAHRGNSRIIVAHGDAGVTIRDTSGDILWTIDTPARLVAHYQGFLVVFHQSEDGTTTLSRYNIESGAPELVESVSPSPIAATTLQRTAFAALGPARLSGSTLSLEDKTIVAPLPISAIAAAPYFPPLVAGLTLLIGLENGDIVIREK